MDFNITMPTEEQLIESSRAWFSMYDGIKLEDLNDDLRMHTFDFIFIPLPVDLIGKTLRLDEDRSTTDLVVSEYEKLMNPAQAPILYARFFGKLNSRSPKDVSNCR